MSKKKTILAIIALVVVLGLMLGIWFASRSKPEPKEDEVSDSKHFTVEVVHSDGTVKTFEYDTNEDYLGAVLVEEGLVVESDSPGMYNTVDGEDAIWEVNKSYWGFFVNGEYAMEGMNTTLIEDGAVYRLEYTLG